jgi:MYXO-CTERM domain-containing protein
MRKILVAGLLVVCGCQRVALVDNIDLTLDFTPLVGPSDALHTPYVVGATFDVWVQTAQKQSLANWTITSSDSTILSTGTSNYPDDHSLYVTVHAQTVGSVNLSVLDDHGSVQHTHPIEIRQPNRIDMLSHGSLIIGKGDAAALASNPAVLAGGQGTFLTRYYDGTTLLSGNGALTVAPSGGVDANVLQSFLFENRDWLQVTATGTGSGSVGLVVGGQTVAQLPVDVVPESALASMDLLGLNESQAHKNDWLVVLAQPYDSTGRVVFGANFSFTTNGVAADGIGDLYRYTYDATKPVMLEATHGILMDGVLIHSSGGFVDSTNHVFCSTSPGAPPASPVVLLIAASLLGLAFLRRRRAQ